MSNNKFIKPSLFLSKDLSIAASYYVVSKQYCSKSGLQRYFSIDYQKATEIIEFLIELKFIRVSDIVKFEVIENDISTMKERLDRYYNI
ncbi:MAG TPA: DNA translocase FtsK [Paludibacter sp.]|nr:DNA translocase FtsK [Paludibacter sp.]